VTYDEVVKLAFIDELQKIAAARPESKLAGLSEEQLLEFFKEAGFMDALKGGASALKKALPQSGTAKFLASAKTEGLGDVAMGALKKSKPSARLQQWGQTMRQTPVQRVRAAAKAATNPVEKAMLKMKPGDVRGLTQATKDIGGTSVGKRMLGAAAEGAGTHMGHAGAIKTVGAHVGVPTAGALEGLVKQTGRELKSVGTNLRAAQAGQMSGAAGVKRAVGKATTGVGRGVMRAAPILGEGLEAGAMLATGAPVLTGLAGGAVPGMAMAAAKGGKAGLIAKKMMGSKVLGHADTLQQQVRKQGLMPTLRQSRFGGMLGGAQPA